MSNSFCVDLPVETTRWQLDAFMIKYFQRRCSQFYENIPQTKQPLVTENCQCSNSVNHLCIQVILNNFCSKECCLVAIFIKKVRIQIIKCMYNFMYKYEKRLI